ncbi:hypothetical protein BKA82DRAFT_4020678 [Pisolithus tinctorius]|nr:hypothetical protein BKA82DRAFT_4020678 [Pisolithus tinctorius]
MIEPAHKVVFHVASPPPVGQELEIDAIPICQQTFIHPLQQRVKGATNQHGGNQGNASLMSLIPFEVSRTDMQTSSKAIAALSGDSRYFSKARESYLKPGGYCVLVWLWEGLWTPIKEGHPHPRIEGYCLSILHGSEPSWVTRKTRTTYASKKRRN